MLGVRRRQPAGTAPAGSALSTPSVDRARQSAFEGARAVYSGGGLPPESVGRPSTADLLAGAEIVVHEAHESAGEPQPGAGAPGGTTPSAAPGLPPVWARWRAWGGGALLALCFGLFGWQAWRGRQPVPVVIEPGGSAGSGAQIAVQVTGAVATPGVYRLTLGDRVDDAIRAAGGFAPGADPSRLNLAQRLRDEQRLDVPFAPAASPTGAAPAEQGVAEAPPSAGEPSPAPRSSATPGPAATPRPAQAPRPSATPKPAATAAPATGAPAERLNVNTATAAQLEKLPGIGPASAKKIVDYRATHGRLSSLDDLRRAGLSETIVRRAADYLSFD